MTRLQEILLEVMIPVYKIKFCLDFILIFGMQPVLIFEFILVQYCSNGIVKITIRLASSTQRGRRWPKLLAFRLRSLPIDFYRSVVSVIVRLDG